MLINSIVGLPWLCAATVRSVNHLQSLSEKDETTGAIVSVQQTRLMHLGIHVLVLVTLFAMDVLKAIPMSVLYGVFLYMGLAALRGNQLFERCLMLLMQPGKYPKSAPYVGRLSQREIFGMTAIQVGLFALMYVLKTVKQTAIAFPLVIAACIPVRLYVLPRLFSAHALALLDGDDDEVAAAIAKKADGDARVKSPTEETAGSLPSPAVGGSGHDEEKAQPASSMPDAYPPAVVQVSRA